MIIRILERLGILQVEAYIRADLRGGSLLVGDSELIRTEA